MTGTLNGGCVNFITAAGGFLQSIVFGYGGVRLREDQLDINPYLLPETSSWRMYGLHYRGAIFDLFVEQNETTLTLTAKPSGVAVNLKLADNTTTELQVLEPFTFRRQPATVMTSDEGGSSPGGSTAKVGDGTSRATGNEPFLAVSIFLYLLSMIAV